MKWLDLGLEQIKMKAFICRVGSDRPLQPDNLTPANLLPKVMLYSKTAKNKHDSAFKCILSYVINSINGENNLLSDNIHIGMNGIVIHF